MPHRGFSLLEVILSLAILVASSMALLQLLTVGGQHQTRLERRTAGQLIGQSLLDQWKITPSERQQVDREPVPGYIGWEYSSELAETEIPGVMAVRLRVYESTPTRDERSDSANSRLVERPAWEAVQWMRQVEPSQNDAFSNRQGGLE